MKCVYCLDFPDGKRYVGSTTNLKLRMSCHRNVNNSKKSNPELKEAILLGGYEVIVLEQCPDDFTKEQLQAREAHYISLWWDYGILYNKRKNTSGRDRGGPAWNKGIPRTPEDKAKIRAANKGRKHTEGAKAKMSAVKRNPAWQYTDEIKALRATGLALREIAKKYNCTSTVIRRICLSYNLIT